MFRYSEHNSTLQPRIVVVGPGADRLYVCVPSPKMLLLVSSQTILRSFKPQSQTTQTLCRPQAAVKMLPRPLVFAMV